MKIGPYLSRRVIADLQTIIGVRFKSPDTLTRTEAAQIQKWASMDRTLVKIAMDKSHREHASVTLFGDVVRHFATTHKQDGDAPAPWPAREGGDRKIDPSNPAASLNAEEAEAHKAWVQTRAEFREAMADPAHPDYAAFKAMTGALHDVIAAGAASAAPVQDGKMSPDQAARLTELRADPAYGNARDPAHADIMAKVTRLFQEAHPAPAGGQLIAAPAPNAGELARDRIRELQGHPAYQDARHPEHAATVTAMLQAHEAALPAPTAEEG